MTGTSTRSIIFSTRGAGARLASCFSSSAMRRFSSRGSSDLACSIVAAIRSRSFAMSIGARAPTRGAPTSPTFGVAELSKVSRRRTWTRRKTSSQPGLQNQAVPIGSDGSDDINSSRCAGVPWTLIHASIASRSCGAIVRKATSTSIWVSTSLLSTACAA